MVVFHVFTNTCYCMNIQHFTAGGCMDRELSTQVMIERVEMIARLATEGICRERDKEIALSLIAEIAKGNLIKNSSFPLEFSTKPFER